MLWHDRKPLSLVRPAPVAYAQWGACIIHKLLYLQHRTAKPQILRDERCVWKLPEASPMLRSTVPYIYSTVGPCSANLVEKKVEIPLVRITGKK